MTPMRGVLALLTTAVVILAGCGTSQQFVAVPADLDRECRAGPLGDDDSPPL